MQTPDITVVRSTYIVSYLVLYICQILENSSWNLTLQKELAFCSFDSNVSNSACHKILSNYLLTGMFDFFFHKLFNYSYGNLKCITLVRMLKTNVHVILLVSEALYSYFTTHFMIAFQSMIYSMLLFYSM